MMSGVVLTTRAGCLSRYPAFVLREGTAENLFDGAFLAQSPACFYGASLSGKSTMNPLATLSHSLDRETFKGGLHICVFLSNLLISLNLPYA